MTPVTFNGKRVCIINLLKLHSNKPYLFHELTPGGFTFLLPLCQVYYFAHLASASRQSSKVSLVVSIPVQLCQSSGDSVTIQIGAIGKDDDSQSLFRIEAHGRGEARAGAIML